MPTPAASSRRASMDGCSASAIVNAVFEPAGADGRRSSLSAREALAGADSGTRLAVAAELHNRVCEALACPSAKQRVLQRTIGFMALVPQDVVVRTKVLQLSMDQEGCRLVQVALDEGDSGVRSAIASELRGHVCDAVESPHANHVLQRLVELVPPKNVCFVLEEYRYRWGHSSPSMMAKHRFGCRVLERVIEHFTACHKTAGVLAEFLDSVLQDLATLCYHSFGTFVVQHILEYGSAEQQHKIVSQLLQENLTRAALDMHAVGVIDKALSFPPAQDQRALAHAVLSNDGLLLQMAATRKGLPAAERLMRIIDGAALNEARRQIENDKSKNSKSKGGRCLAQLADAQLRPAHCARTRPVSSVAVHSPPPSPPLQFSAAPAPPFGSPPLESLPELELAAVLDAGRPRVLSALAAEFVPTSSPTCSPTYASDGLWDGGIASGASGQEVQAPPGVVCFVPWLWGAAGATCTASSASSPAPMCCL